MIFNAVIISQLTYGLETLPLTSDLISRLNAFQMKGFRKILKINHPFYSRVSNAEILETLNLNVGEAKEIRIKTVSEMIEEKKIKLLGHCIRAEKDDPMRQPFFETRFHNVQKHIHQTSRTPAQKMA